MEPRVLAQSVPRVLLINRRIKIKAGGRGRCRHRFSITGCGGSTSVSPRSTREACYRIGPPLSSFVSCRTISALRWALQLQQTTWSCKNPMSCAMPLLTSGMLSAPSPLPLAHTRAQARTHAESRITSDAAFSLQPPFSAATFDLYSFRSGTCYTHGTSLLMCYCPLLDGEFLNVGTMLIHLYSLSHNILSIASGI